MIYLDTSALLDRIYAQNNHVAVNRTIARAVSDGTTIVSSRLIHLECRRAQIREKSPWGPIRGELDGIDLLPITDEVWSAAHDIDVHVRTLDALHLATCAIVDARLLTSDSHMASVARRIGVYTIEL